ncbi:TPA: helix-turn-helix domain-containing protein [Bacillus cereus]|nr:helix-turn-helix domain-containing protein [Bacillus cereus]
MNVDRCKPTFLYNKVIIQESEVQPMLVNKAYKFCISLNNEQEIMTAKTIGCSRFVFHCFLLLNQIVRSISADWSNGLTDD